MIGEPREIEPYSGTVTAGGNRKILFRNGTIIVGTGSPARSGGVLVIGEDIVQVGEFPAPADARD